MKKLIHSFGTPRRAGRPAPTLVTRNESRDEEYRARAADCQLIADRWPGLIKDQYAKLAHQWLVLAERWSTQAETTPAIGA
jgi:hypothetical protein